MGHRERSRDAIKRTELEGRGQCWWEIAQVSSMVFVSPPPEPPELTLNCLRPRPDVASACHDWTRSSSASTRVELAPCSCVRGGQWCGIENGSSSGGGSQPGRASAMLSNSVSPLRGGVGGWWWWWG